MAKSDFSYVKTRFPPDFAIALRFSKHKSHDRSQALLERWPQDCRVKIVYKTTDESFRFHSKNFDEMHCKLDSTENPRSLKSVLF